jgi:capsular exopolysaccharide synthesis family protein
LDLRRFLAILKRWAGLLLAGAALAGAAAFAVSAVLAPPPIYEAQAVVLVGPALTTSDANSSQMDVARRLSQIYVEVANSRPLLERVADELQLGVTADELAGQLTVTTPEEPPIINVASQANEAATAAAIANEVVQQLIAAAPSSDDAEAQAQGFIEQQVDALEREIETLIPEVERLADRPSRTAAEDARLAELQSRLADLRATYAALIAASSPTASNQLTVIEEAVPADRPLPTGRAQTVLFASFLGLLLAASVALLVEHLDDTIRSPDDSRRVSALANLGEVGRMASSGRPLSGPLATALAPYSPLGEEFRALRTAIEFAAGETCRSLLVASPLPGEGKTAVATNLAAAFARSGREVLLIDANLREPAAHEAFGLSNAQGLTDLLRTPSAQLAKLAQETDVPGLRLLTAGVSPPNPADLLDSSRMKDLIAEVHATGDLVIFDGSPVLGASETSVLASVVDATLLVIAAGRTPSASLGEAHEALGRARARVIGTVLNRVPSSSARRHIDARAAEGSDASGRSLREDHSGS